MGRKLGKCSPKKPSFFKILIGDFSKHLLIPPKFTKNYIRPSLGQCRLRGPDGHGWNVKLKRRENGLFFHGSGWQSFVKYNKLQVGDFLVFRYVDDQSRFKVKMYDSTCCEKDVIVKRKTRDPGPSSSKGSKFARVKDEIIDLETENRSRKCVKSGKRLKVEQVQEPSVGPIIFKSEKSCFVRSVKARCMRYRLNVPKELAVAEGLMNERTAEIQDASGRSWPVKLVIAHGKTYCDRLDISTGWGECFRANKISIGDTLVFEFVKKSVMRLHIYRKGLGGRGGCCPSVVLQFPNMMNQS